MSQYRDIVELHREQVLTKQVATHLGKLHVGGRRMQARRTGTGAARVAESKSTS